MFKRCVDEAQRYNFMIHTHLAETEIEWQECIQRFRCTPVERLERLGVFQSKTIAAHVIHVDDNDINILSENNVVISHNPTSNMKLGSGIFPFEKIFKANCDLTLGID